jgi:hypothetical protein
MWDLNSRNSETLIYSNHGMFVIFRNNLNENWDLNHGTGSLKAHHHTMQSGWCVDMEQCFIEFMSHS